MLQAQVYRRRGEFFACSVSVTDDGLGVIGPPFLFASAEAGDAELASMVRRCLAASRTGIPRLPREERKKHFDAILELAKVKSSATFNRGTTLASVEQVGDTISVEPSRNDGGTYSTDPDAAERVPADDDEALGAAVRRALGGVVIEPAGRAAFGWKTAWLAVRGAEVGAVAEALGLQQKREASWDVLDEVYEHGGGVFVAPPIDGWTLVTGIELLFAHTPTWDGAADLARKLDTEVQGFVTHRVSEVHGWARAGADGLERAFEYVGESHEIVANLGRPTAVEVELAIPSPREAPTGPAPLSIVPITEATVMVVARSWSIDPTWIEGEDDALGIHGHLPDR